MRPLELPAPGTMATVREVRSPHGTVWECFIEWEGRRPLHRALRRVRDRREARAAKQAENSSLDLTSGCDPLGGVDSLAVVAVVVLVALILVFAGPWIVAGLFGVVELAVVFVLSVVVFVGRTVLRRPWRVVAVSGGGLVWAWHQVGWIASRELVRVVAAELEAGRNPDEIYPEAAAGGSPTRLDPDAPLGLIAEPWARVAAMAFILVGCVASIIVLAVRLG
ncbi:MAG: hypothetical protein AAF480_13340 [Actinomycetota bacterium]